MSKGKCRLSVLPCSLFSDIENGKISLRQWFEKSKELGLDAADISMMLLKNHTPTYLSSVKKDMEDVGIKMAMASTYPDFTHPDKLQREREYYYLCEDIAKASELGLEYLRVLAGQAHPEMGRSEGITLASEFLIKSAEVAKQFGVTLVYEDHYKPGAWYYADFSYPLDIFVEIANNIKGSGVKINFDTGNVTSLGKDVMYYFNLIRDELATVHISDMAREGDFTPVVIGTGVTPNAEVLKALKYSDFDGLVCIEESSNTGFDGIAKAVKYVRETWEMV